jgi:hypothetical protein
VKPGSDTRDPALKYLPSKQPEVLPAAKRAAWCDAAGDSAATELREQSQAGAWGRGGQW